ncbi:hypothetical protein F4678DRAFT_474320 [Xylaria arbuscula]|nr:hypothetical protein F4678DRAFT_474320 [Xylaria arbuscula]
MGSVASIPTDPSQEVQVISAGYSRTGTAILHGGTQILVRDDDYCATWIGAYQARNAGDRERTLKLVRRATAGFVATADLPPADFMPEMMELYPDAKWRNIAALTTWTTPWWLGFVTAPIPGWRYLPSFAREYSRSTQQLAGVTGKTDSLSELIKSGGPHILQAHCDKVRALVPTGQLLEMDLSQGWEPLYRFLDVPILDEPFPRVNDA